MKIKKEMLIKAAQELNEVMGLNPPIDIEEDESVIKAKLIKALEFREDEDEFSVEVEETLAYLEDEQVEEELEQEEEELEQEEEEKEEVEDDEDEDDNDVEEEEKEEVNKEVKKISKKKGETKLTRLAFIESLIAAGKYTKKEIMEKTLQEFPDTSRTTVHTILSSSKNPKYKKFKRLAKEDDRGVLSFL